MWLIVNAYCISFVKEQRVAYNIKICLLYTSGMFDGRLMAIPETVIDHGPCLLWLRKDWMEELDLAEPKTLEEAFTIIEEFKKNRMGTEPGEEPIGLLCDTSLVGTTSTNY